MTLSPGRDLVTAFVHGLDHEEIADLTHRLRHLPQFHAFPTFLAATLLEYRIDVATATTREAHLSIGLLEHESGMHPQWSRGGHPGDGIEKNTQAEPSIDNLDFQRLTHDLTATSARLGHYAFICKVHLPMFDILDSMNAALVHQSAPQTKELLTRADVLLRSNNAHFREYARATLYRIEALSNRVQAQQSTIFSLIAQRDNRINQTTADQSIKIARLSAQDGQIMKQLAHAATQDSSAMRSISIVTIWFLPATFVATLFSTSFFDFNEPGRPPRVSSWIWIYFVLSFALTGLVHLVWILGSRTNSKRAFSNPT